MAKHFSTMALASVLLASTAITNSAIAQEQSDEEIALETIVVTAERRESTLQDTPIAISAIGGDQLRNSAIFDTETIAASIPGLIVQRDVVGKAVIRGIGNENFTVGGDPGVAIYSDGSYVARSNAAIFDFFDVERVEVLRGPQATLYGRNAIGGVINLVSKAPTEEFEGYVNATYGNFDAIRLEGAVSGAVADNVRVRLAGLYSKRDGFTENIQPGVESRGLDELDDKDLFAIRGRIDVDLSDNLTLELIGDIYRDDSNPPPFFYPEGSPFVGPDSVLPSDIRTVSQGLETEVPGITDIPGVEDPELEQSSITGRLTWETDAATIVATSSYRDTGFEWVNDGDGFSDFLVVYFQRDASESFTQDIQITSNNDGPFQWIVGGTYFTEDSDGLYAIPLGPAFGATTIVYQGTNETDAYGVFVEGKYTFGDLAFTAGIRYSDETKDATLNFGQSAPFGAAVPFDQIGTVPGGLLIPTVPPRFENDAITPRFVLDYNLNETTLLYASATRGFKSGGFSLLDFPINSFEPEFVWAFEVGSKSRLFDNRLELNTAAFYYDYTDQQLSQVTNLATQTTNAGSSTIWGFEMEFRALVTANFQIDGNFAYLDTEFDLFCTLDSRDTSRPIDTQNCPNTPNLAGNRLPRSPDITANLAASYFHDFGNGTEGVLRAEWQYTGDQFFSVFNRDNIAQDGYSVLNVSGGVTFDEGRWGIRAWARNLTNTDYFTNLFESGVITGFALPQGFVAPPRTYGLTVSTNF